MENLEFIVATQKNNRTTTKPLNAVEKIFEREKEFFENKECKNIITTFLVTFMSLFMISYMIFGIIKLPYFIASIFISTVTSTLSFISNSISNSFLYIISIAVLLQSYLLFFGSLVLFKTKYTSINIFDPKNFSIKIFLGLISTILVCLIKRMDICKALHNDTKYWYFVDKVLYIFINIFFLSSFSGIAFYCTLTGVIDYSIDMYNHCRINNLQAKYLWMLVVLVLLMTYYVAGMHFLHSNVVLKVI